MANIIVVHGPKGCGKTRNHALLKERLGAPACWDDFSVRDAAIVESAKRVGRTTRLLLLTSDGPDEIKSALPDAEVIDFAEAMA